MDKERRYQENKALRELVDALREFIAARDGLWTLGFLDRVFHREKYLAVLKNYDFAGIRVRNAILKLKTVPASPKTGGSSSSNMARSPLISLEEFEVLLGRPALQKHRGTNMESKQHDPVNREDFPL